MEAAHDFESVIPQYPVKLDSFEGPLDLLVHLIRRHEIDIYDIPIVLVTRQYLEYLDLMRELDLDVAGEFLVMAATLIQIKARMLIPRPATPEEAGDAVDPREALVQRLIEHQQYRSAADLLRERETLRSAQWMRPDNRVADIAGQPMERELEVDLFSLLQAFQAVVSRARERRPLPLPADAVSIEQRVEQLLERLSSREACGFEDLFDGDRSRADLVTTFLALLEMVRLKLVRLFQPSAFAPIRVYRRERPGDAPRPEGTARDA